MPSASHARTHPAGLTAVLAVVRLVMALFDRLFADIADLPENHPDRRLHARVVAELRRVEARILADMAHAARTPPTPIRPARSLPHTRTASKRPGASRRAACLTLSPQRTARAPPPCRSAPSSPPQTRALTRAHIDTITKQ